MKKVKDYMDRDIPVVNKQTPIEKIMNIFSTTHYNIIPVVDENNILCGIISIEDILENLILSKKDVELLAKFPFFADAFSEILIKIECISSLIVAEDVMRKEVIKVEEDASVMKALILMRKHGINRIVVVNEKGEVVGFMTRNRVLRAMGC